MYGIETIVITAVATAVTTVMFEMLIRAALSRAKDSPTLADITTRLSATFSKTGALLAIDLLVLWYVTDSIVQSVLFGGEISRIDILNLIGQVIVLLVFLVRVAWHGGKILQCEERLTTKDGA